MFFFSSPPCNDILHFSFSFLFPNTRSLVHHEGTQVGMVRFSKDNKILGFDSLYQYFIHYMSRQKYYSLHYPVYGL